jgi:hypothetical protein
MHISCLTTYHPTLPIQSPPFHYCPTTPLRTKPIPTIPNCLDLSRPSTQLNTMTALSHHTMPLEYILAAAASPERTSPFLVATFPTLPVLCTLPALPIPNFARPLHTSCLTISIPNLSIQADPFQCKPAQPNLTKQNLSWPRLPDHKTPHQTAPVLSVKLLDCLNIPHASRPRRTFANFLPDLSRSVSYPISPVHCKLPAAPHPTRPITSVPRLPFLP